MDMNNLDIMQMLTDVVRIKASDLHITVAIPPMIRINQSLRPYNDTPLILRTQRL
jgi:twitching motility protein PilT